MVAVEKYNGFCNTAFVVPFEEWVGIELDEDEDK